MGEGNVIPTQAYPPSNDAPVYHTDDTPGALPPPTAEPTAGAVSVPPSSCEPPNEEDKMTPNGGSPSTLMRGLPWLTPSD